MPNRITYTRPDGGVSVVVPASEFVAQFDTRAEALAAITARSVPTDATDVEVVDTNTLPTDRTFRDAWVKSSGVVTVAMPKARTIHMDRIRVSRNKELDNADNALRKAQDGNDQLEVNRQRARRKKLRDLPQTFDLSAAMTPGELEALWPPDLPARNQTP